MRIIIVACLCRVWPIISTWMIIVHISKVTHLFVAIHFDKLMTSSMKPTTLSLCLLYQHFLWMYVFGKILRLFTIAHRTPAILKSTSLILVIVIGAPWTKFLSKWRLYPFKLSFLLFNTFPPTTNLQQMTLKASRQKYGKYYSFCLSIFKGCLL